MLDLSGEPHCYVSEEDVLNADRLKYKLIRHAADAIITPLARDAAASKGIALIELYKEPMTMALTQQDILKITEEIVKNLSGAPERANARRACRPDRRPAGCTGRWLCDTAEEAVQNAKLAQQQLADSTLEKRGELIEAMRKAAIDNAEMLARMAHEETGYGSVAAKTQKNLPVARRTPGVEDLSTYCKTGDNGMMLIEQAPFGVIGSITPSTNPTSTVINNSISMIAAGNGVVFNPHPAAKKSSQEAMRLMNEAIVRAGGPATLITTVKEPTLESGQRIMTHPDVAILSITGGEAGRIGRDEARQKVHRRRPRQPARHGG